MSFAGAPATIGFVGLIIVVHVVLASSTEARIWAIENLAFFPIVPIASLMKAGPFEAWRLLSYALLHDGLLHIGLNTAVFVILAPPAERLGGSRRFAALLLATAAAGAAAHGGWAYLSAQLGLVSAEFALLSPVVGASGVVCGILGFDIRRRCMAMARSATRHSSLSPGQWFWRVSAVFLLANLALGLIDSFISGAAHIGGYLVGAVLAPWLLRRGELFDVISTRPFDPS